MEPLSPTSPHVTDDQAVALFDNRVDEATRQRIDEHLDVCDECRELVGALALAGAPEIASRAEAPLDDRAEDGSVTLLRSSGVTAPPSSPSGEGAPLARGDMVDHFRIMRTLGRGAMGEVYLARDTKLGRKVALKIIAPDLLGSDKAVRRFLFEARATARFNHPNIVTIHAVGEHDGRPWVALEYVEGENLRERGRRERPPLGETLRIGLAMAEALAEAHDRGVLHRDLKPANVVIGTDGRIRIVDFGLAKAVQATEEDVEAGVHAISSSTWLVGTPRYMAPEQWEGSDVGGAADVWALGVILFELISGRRPFEADSTVELLRLVCSDDPAPRLSGIVPVPSELSRLVGSCLAKEPSSRPTPREIADQLRDILQPTMAALGLGDGPFRGLLPFGEARGSLFFGRESEVDAFIERLRRQTIIPVVGPSGGGKSSFVQAGVVPRLRERESWLVIQLRPGPRPFETLAAQLERTEATASSPSTSGATEGSQLPTLTAVDTRAESLRASPRQLALELLDLARRTGGKVLLFIDQLEEVFTLVEPPEQQAFVEAIANAADDLDDPVRVVLTLRHDFIDRLAAVGGAASPLAQFFALKTPDRRMLEHTLRKPAKQVGYAFEDDALVEQMIAAVQGEPACLALLQFAAHRLWELRDEERKILPRSAYEAMGGVGGALARHADAQLNALAPSQERIARSLLQRLVTPERTRRLVPRGAALAGLGRDAESVLERLTEARLVSVIKLRRGEEPRIELTHGALINTWGTLSALVERGEEEDRLVEEAGLAADLWDKRGRRPEELWRGPALRDAERHLAEADLPQGVADFLRASHDAERQRHRARRLGRLGMMVGLALVASTAIAVSLFIHHQRTEERAARHRAEEDAARLRVAAARAALAAARASLDDRDPAAAREHLRRALQLDDRVGARLLWMDLHRDPLRSRGPASSVGPVEPGATRAPLPDDVGVPAHVVRAQATMEDRLALAVDGALLAGTSEALHAYAVPHPVERLRFAEDGMLEARGGGEVTRWDVSLVPEPRPHPGRVVALTLVGESIVSVDAEGTWRERRGGRTWRAHPSPLVQPSALALSPDGSELVGARDGAVVMWSPEKPPRRVEEGSPTRALAFASDGSLAMAGDAEIHVLGPDGQRRTRRLKLDEPPARIAVAADGRLAVADPAGRLSLFAPGVTTPELVGDSTGPVTALALGADHMVAVRADHIEILSLREGRSRRLPIAGVTAVALDDAGHLLIASSDGEVGRRSAKDGRRLTGSLALLPAGLVTMRGMIDPVTGESRPVADSWLRALLRRGRAASQRREGAPLCVMTTDDHLAVWSTGADRRMGEHQARHLRQVLGLPSGCAAITDEEVLLTSGGEPRALAAPSPRAIGWGKGRLLVVTPDALIAFSETGEPQERRDLAGRDVTAVAQTAETFILGHEDGRLSWIGPSDGAVVRQRGASSSPVVAIEPGPRGLVAIGHGDGTIALTTVAATPHRHAHSRGAPLWNARLSGPVAHLRLGQALVAASLSGDVATWSLEELDIDRCGLLDELRRRDTEEGIAAQPLPPDHPCRR